MAMMMRQMRRRTCGGVDGKPISPVHRGPHKGVKTPTGIRFHDVVMKNAVEISNLDTSTCEEQYNLENDEDRSASG
eukprot:4197452-Amphidinium_carterae.1